MLLFYTSSFPTCDKMFFPTQSSSNNRSIYDLSAQKLCFQGEVLFSYPCATLSYSIKVLFLVLQEVGLLDTFLKSLYLFGHNLINFWAEVKYNCSRMIMVVCLWIISFLGFSQVRYLTHTKNLQC
jgi:hypothetical protein